MKNNMLENFFFIHVPKTGGTFVKVSLPEISDAKKYGYPTHSTYDQISQIIENKIIFTVVRNPYEWLESFYFFEITRSKIKKRNPNIIKFDTFQDFVLNEGFKFLGPRQSDYVGNVPVENIIKTERLNDMLIDFFKKYDIQIVLKNEKIRENDLKKSIVWSEKMKEKVYSYYNLDFEKFGYDK